MAEIVSKYIECYVYKKFGKKLKYLLLKRSNSKEPFPGIWQIVTGKMEEGEKAFETALREVKEETGLNPVSVFVAQRVNEFYTPHNNRIYLIPVFIAEVESEYVTLSVEHIKYKWLRFNKAYKKIHWQNQKEIFKQVNKSLKNENLKNNLIKIL